MKSTDYRPDIDGLRALAVLAVIVFHAFPDFAPGGFAGVDVFFVISGYLISRIIFSGLDNGKFSFRRFYTHRINRILPALIVLLLACLIIGWFVMMPGEYMRLGEQITASVLFMQNIKLWHDVGYFDVTAELKPLLHLWSLSIEEQFYLFYPLLIWIAWKVRLNRLILLLILGVVSLAMNMAGLGIDQYKIFYLLHTRFWELVAGGIIAYLNLYSPTQFFNTTTAHRKNSFLNISAIAGLLSIIFVVTRTNNTNANTLLIGWMLAVVGTCLLVNAGRYSWINRHILANRLLVYIGLISYPLYLWHWSLLSFLRLLQRDHQLSLIQKFAAIALSFTLAWITYEWIEKPFRNKNNRIKVAVLICLLILTGLSGAYVSFSGGLPTRYPEQVQPIATYSYDGRAYAKYGECWVAREPPQNTFSPQCLGALASPTSKHTVLVWGDSHAAHLYPGIDELFGSKHQVAEFVRSTCPPILGMGEQLGLNRNTPDCLSGNEEVFAIIKKHIPETVVLFAFWGGYGDRWTAESPLAAQLLNTIHKLQAAGVKNIVLMGPAPQWTHALPYLVLEETLDDFPQYRIPQYLNHGFKPISGIIDADLKSLVSQEKGVQYFSTLDALCGSQGCLVHTDPEPTSFTSFDYAHFTLYGARYVAKQLPLAVNQNAHAR